MPAQKLRYDIFTKCEAYAAVILTPTNDVLVRVGPQEVAQQARVGYVRRPHDALNLLHILQLGGETAVHAEDLLVDDGGNGQTVEAIRKSLPQLDVVASFALVIEAVYSVNTA